MAEKLWLVPLRVPTPIKKTLEKLAARELRSVVKQAQAIITERCAAEKDAAEPR